MDESTLGDYALDITEEIVENQDKVVDKVLQRQSELLKEG